MRSSTFILAGPLAASAQMLSSITGGTQTATISSGSEVLYTTTWTYSNPATNYLTETNSAGVVTGQPSGSVGGGAGGQPMAVTSQPAVATIPAGLPTGETYIPYNASGTVTSFQVSVGSSTTVVIGGANGASVTTGGSSASGSGSAGSGSGSSSGGAGGSGSNSNSGNSGSNSNSGNSGASGSASASASQSGNSASSVQVAGAGMGLLAFIAALL